MLSAIADADIIDLRELSSGDQPEIFIGFDDVPELLNSRVNGRAIELEFSGPYPRVRRIEPAGARWILAVEAMPSEFGQLVRIELPDSANELDVIPTESGYRLSWVAIAAVGDWAGPSEPESEVSALMPSTTMEIAETSIEAAMPTPNGEPAADLSSARSPNSSLQADACDQAAALMESDPWDIDALTRHAVCLLDDGQAEEATVLLERVIAFEPGRFDAVIALAEAHAARGNIESARALYEQAANVAATDGQAVAARALARELVN